jgi:hypothetical protein
MKQKGKITQQKAPKDTIKKNVETAAEKKDKVFAITALVCGLLFWVPLFNILLGALAILFGVLAIRRARENPERYGGQGMAVAGMILGIISVVFTLTSFYLAIFHPELGIGLNVTAIK